MPTPTTALLTIPLPQGQLTLTTHPTPAAEVVTLYLAHAKPLSIDQPPEPSATRALQITPPPDLEAVYLARYLGELAAEAKLKLEHQPTEALPANQRKLAAKFWATVVPFLPLLGIDFAAEKKRPAKAQHRFKAAIAKVPFTVDYNGAQATVFWQKRNELRIEPGAKLAAEAPLNADGSLGFSARFATQLREEHAGSFDLATFITTEPIVLKSVNEVGLFLYFGGTNSWLVLKDEEGKSIHDWTIVG